MASRELQEIIKRAELLPVAEQLLLIARLAQQASQDYPAVPPRYAWSDIEGIAPCPLTGEDAQAWVTRTRRESDESRDHRKQ